MIRIGSQRNIFKNHQTQWQSSGPDDGLGLDDVLAVEDDVLGATEHAGPGHPVTTGRLYVLGFVEGDIRQLHYNLQQDPLPRIGS